MSTVILFDATQPRKPPRGFGEGLYPCDQYGNRLPRVGYTVADAEWWAAQNQTEEEKAFDEAFGNWVEAMEKCDWITDMDVYPAGAWT